MAISRIESGNDFVGNCSSCSKRISPKEKFYNYTRDRSIVFPFESKLLCNNCFKAYSQCRNCRGTFLKIDIKNKTCPSCIHKSNRFLIQNYSFKVENEFTPQGKSLDEIFYGVELELESENYGYDTFITHDCIKNFACLKKDSSIEQGFEIVSCPCTLDIHYKIWDEFFENTSPTLKAHRTCGMHVHASRVRLTDLQIGKMLVFLHRKENRNFIKLIAGRASSYHNNYEIPKSIKDGKNGGNLPQNSDRHTALNLIGDKTIEFRIFKATKNKDIFLKNIEFCKALIDFTHSSIYSIPESAEVCNFIKFVEKMKNEYHYLYKFLEQKLPSALTKHNKSDKVVTK